MESKDSFKKADLLLKHKDYENASKIYSTLMDNSDTAPVACYRLAQIANETGDPVAAKNLYYDAFKLKPDICELVLPANHCNRTYKFPGIKDLPAIETCHLCGKKGQPYWCYILPEVASTFRIDFNPVRTWMYCDNCHHLYADEFPVQEVISSKNTYNPPMRTIMRFFPYYSEILTKLANFSQGNDLLEIGIGGCECSLVAQEMGFNVLGIDILESNVLQAQSYGIDAEVADFMNVDFGKKWDVIILGDVLEHVSNPVLAIEKVRQLLNDNGVIWISTPTFDGATARMLGHNDPMRRETGHLSYFSRQSLFSLLNRFGLVPIDYRISSHYNGSVEIIANVQ